MNTACFLPYIGLGSCLMHLPYIHEFAKKEGPITVMTFSKSFADALELDPHVKETIVIEKYHKKVFDIFKLSSHFKSLNLKKLYIFKCSLRFYIAAKLAGIYTKSYPFYKKSNLHLVKQGREFTIKHLKLKDCPTETRLQLDKKIINDSKKIMQIGKKKNFNSPC